MFALKSGLLASVVAIAAATQSADTLLQEKRLSVHTLLREDIFAGFRTGNMARQRTGRSAEATETLDRMVTLLAGTPYEAMAKQWKADPSSAATSNLTCKNCHTPGRLANRLEALKQP